MHLVSFKWIIACNRSETDLVFCVFKNDIPFYFNKQEDLLHFFRMLLSNKKQKQMWKLPGETVEIFKSPKLKKSTK